MNLVTLDYRELDRLSKKVGDIHKFKENIMNTKYQIARFDVFKDIDSYNKDIYVALKHPNQYDNFVASGDTLY